MDKSEKQKEIIVSVDMTEERAESFKLFCQYEGFFKYLLKNGVFSHRLGKIILHYSSDGKRMGVHKEDRSPEEFIFPQSSEN